MQRILLLTVLLSQVSIIYGQSPGGVSGSLLFWVKADAGTFEDNGSNTAEDGDGVWVWDDNSSTDNDAQNATSGTRPIYRTNIINGNPALEFDGTKFLDSETSSGIGDTESFYMFLVFKQDSYQTNGGTLDGNGTFIIDRPTATFNLTSFKVVNTDKYFYQRREDDNSDLGGPVSLTPVNTSSFVITDYYRNRISGASSREGIYLNGALEVDQAGPTGNIPGPPIRIGRHATNLTGGLDGYFAEMVVYNTNLSSANRQRIESYLAVKYGITLDAGMDYVRSDGTVIYPSTGSHASYVTDIAGIGRDDNADLNQTTSTSQNTNSIVTVSNASLLGDEEFLLWGSNNGSLTTPNTVDVDGSIVERRLSRVWMVAETGNVGTVTMAFDLSAVPGAKVQADLRLLVDRDGDGFADNDRTPRTGTLAGNIFTVTNVNIADGDYFTIGTVNAVTTPLPVELTEFNVTYENPIVVASWQTASELNNDFFTLERAGEDLLFDEIGIKPGAGTSKIPHAYSIIDSSPYEGRSYYRLKQTDFDGTVSYSDTKYMLIKESEKKISIFPNPSEGKEIRVRWGNSKFNLDHIEIINQQGQTIEVNPVDKENQQEYEIELKQRLSPGFYIVKVYYNGKEEFAKFIVR